MAINIKPSKRGTFTAAATKRGKTVQGFASAVLANKENYSPAMVKKANFARNAAKWKKELGGYLDQELNTPIIEETPVSSGMTPINTFQDGGYLDLSPQEKIQFDAAAEAMGHTREQHAAHTFRVGGSLDALKYLDNPQPQGLFGQVAKGVGASVGGLAGGIGGLMQQGLAPTADMSQMLNAPQGAIPAGPTQPQILPVPQTKYNELGGPLYAYGGNLMGLPEYSFGSWMGDNAGGILQGAGDAVSAIPGIGMIAGPILNMAGKVTDALVGKKRAADAAKALKVKERLAEVRTGAEQQISSTDVPQYAAVAEFGGDLMAQETDFPAPNQNPVIQGYDGNSNTHQQGVGGVPVDAKGNPSTVSKQSAVGLTEAGEVTWNGYVFSDKLKV